MMYTAEKYNRYTVKYHSEVPAVASFYFTCEGQTVRELFYLPADKNGEFISCTEGFLEGKLAYGVFDLRIEPRGDGEAVIDDIYVSIADVPASGTYFIENDIVAVNGTFKCTIPFECT